MAVNLTGSAALVCLLAGVLLLLHRANAAASAAGSQAGRARTKPDPAPVLSLKAARVPIAFLVVQLVSLLFALPDETGDASPIQKALCIVFLGIPLWYFAFVICGSLLKAVSSEATDPFSSRRFAGSIFVSSASIIFGSALCFYALGINGPDKEVVQRTDAIYFATVTFSTLGYGDFSPASGSRWLGATLAILGNLHLAAIVGAIFATIRTK